MAILIQNQEGVPDNHLRKQLAIAVRSIQWSYAIFWSISTSQQGLLEWSEGYYNGEIKTRKTMQPMELNADNLGLKRSEQLKDLYESLSEGDTDSQTTKPSAALSPEDLTDAEWYYLVCMSFTFTPGEGLPGRALTTGQHIWLYNAPYADTKVFSRSLLSKTVICFPFLGGVIELGVTELVSEDPNLLQHVKTVFLEFPKFTSCEELSPARNTDNDEGPVCNEFDHEVGNIMDSEEPQVFVHSISPYTPKDKNEFDHDGDNGSPENIYEEFKVDSPHVSSNGCELNHKPEESSMMDKLNGGASQVQSWEFMDNEFTNCVHDSVNSSDCISQTFFTPENTISFPKREIFDNLPLKDLKDMHHIKLTSLDLDPQELHYTRTLSAIFKNTDQLIGTPGSRTGDPKSSFIGWKKVGLVDTKLQHIGAQQKMLKKILFEVAWMHSDCQLKSQKKHAGEVEPGSKNEVDDGVCRFLLEQKKQKLNEQFVFLRSLVPSIGKFDKESILSDTIEYLKELERRVDELESCREIVEEFDARERKKHPDIAERTSDNYGTRLKINKRKACDMDEMDPDLDWGLPEDVLTMDLTVQMVGNEVFIDIFCPWRECLILEIMDAVSNLQLDAHSVQSSTTHDTLTLNLKSKFKGTEVVSEEKIKQSIQRVVGSY
ncbi:hypothetical protein GIB67_022797 [Kingdonia uniflora]|uniref:BHLH domain-containing protein n=1 Tax=Kingdonia uniflora TaxID=39325 RepID=A0A7J7P6Q0_9MAGN|nr:hypothetical protein GIB67_022797 [Kingdonia uniflora]